MGWRPGWIGSVTVQSLPQPGTNRRKTVFNSGEQHFPDAAVPEVQADIPGDERVVILRENLRMRIELRHQPQSGWTGAHDPEAQIRAFLLETNRQLPNVAAVKSRGARPGRTYLIERQAGMDEDDRTRARIPF